MILLFYFVSFFFYGLLDMCLQPLPFVLMFGVASSLDIVARVLPHQILGMLRIQPFVLKHSIE